MPKFNKEPIMDQLKACAHVYGVRILANELNKPYSTLANELNEVDWAKMGLRDALTIIELTQAQDAKPAARSLGVELLDMLAEKFGRVMFKIPPACMDMPGEMKLIAQLSKQYAQMVGKMANALSDGRWDSNEVKECLQISQDLLKAALPIYKHMQNLQTPGVCK